jgi:hypothetical protein
MRVKKGHLLEGVEAPEIMIKDVEEVGGPCLKSCEHAELADLLMCRSYSAGGFTGPSNTCLCVLGRFHP